MTKTRLALLSVLPISLALLAMLSSSSGERLAGLEGVDEAGRAAEPTRTVGAVPEQAGSVRPAAGNAATPVAAREAESAASGEGAAAATRRERRSPSEDAILGRETDRTIQALHSGKLTPMEVLERIRGLDDEGLVSALFEALQASEELLDETALAAWLDMARTESDLDKRYWAIQSLGLLTDDEGRLRSLLYDVALRDPQSDARHAAVDALYEYVDMNPESAAEVAAFAFDLAGAPGDAEFRAKALSVVDPSYLDRTAIVRTGAFLRDDSAEVRFAAAGVLGRARAEDRPEALRILEGTYATEGDGLVRRAAIQSIVEAGLHEALPVLGRLRATEQDPYLATVLDDYRSVLETGEVDLERIESRFEAIQDERYGDS